MESITHHRCGTARFEPSPATRHVRHAAAAAREARHAEGFTLIELMVTVAIVAILSSVAIPSYADYVMRGRLAEATNALTAMHARMEQYYQDNRRYTGGPCATTQAQWAGASAVFSFTCAEPATPTASTYLLVANGTGPATGFRYTVDESGTMTSTFSSSWGGNFYANCWAMKKGGCS